MAPKSPSVSTALRKDASIQSAKKDGSSTPVHAPRDDSMNNFQAIAQGVWKNYVDNTAQRMKLLDAFLAFLVVTGVLQFLYCILVGNYPFNAFLSGFAATVGQFVLTASLRVQTSTSDFSISHERAFADFVFGSLILHFFCVNFIN
ncbi:oligosaccharyl transferase [Piedraia hortae CBS 480.64]|uniref:Dolichyl-diphosphooligosaccharide--protein glycosyltransferase subunit OST2 n=1 Tax=Piedraia hortae CBS 480.64 TaxID=1314780 RepID=A0A6A7BTX1_9PEZI|nr:oligosaccharyl transferase [Piedraia hortae CBS 480.64]